MTATPRYFTGRVSREAKEADFEIASMDNEEKFGPVFHRLGFAEAIKLKLLTDYQVAVVGVDDATYRDWAEQGGFVTLDGNEVTNARTLAGQIGLAKAMRRYDLRRTITFHSRVRSAREFAASMPEVVAWMPARQDPKGKLWAQHVSGEMTGGAAARSAPAPPQAGRWGAGTVDQCPLPGRRGRCAHPRRCGLHRPAPLRG